MQGNIQLSSVHCTGKETRLEYCRRSDWGVTSSSCSHNYDVGVLCSHDYNCSCPHGVPATGMGALDCAADGTTVKCESCHPGFYDETSTCSMRIPVGNEGDNKLRITAHSSIPVAISAAGSGGDTGILEIEHGGVWSTVCAFTDASADVAVTANRCSVITVHCAGKD